MVEESLIEYLHNVVEASGFVRKEVTEASGFVSKEVTEASGFEESTNIHYGKYGKLPHIQQKNAWYFVTFRLADALPKEKIEQLNREREEWLAKHKDLVVEASSLSELLNNLSEEKRQEYYRLFSKRVEDWLNAGYGSCILKNEKIAKIVAETLLYFNHKRYELSDWVIMPNHVHMLIKPLGEYSLSQILHSIKSYSSHKINELTGKKGQVWMHESYDHIIRSERAFKAIRNYIRNNPLKANIELPPYCCSWKITNVAEAPGFGKEVTEASGFERSDERSEDASTTFSMRSEDASTTITMEKIRQLLSYSEEVPEFSEEQKQKIISAIANIKILDPACGSGAFPMGILHKLVLALQKLDPENKTLYQIQREKHREIDEIKSAQNDQEIEEILKDLEETFDEKLNYPDYARKKYLIENCIYGVDIQPIAIQITKLRFFISLILDQKIDRTKENFGIRPLPNLETKFVAANTLIGLERPSQLKLRNPEIAKKEEELKKLRHKYFTAKTRTQKQRLQERDKKLRQEIANLLINDGWGEETANKIASFDIFDQNASADWFDPEWMFGIVIEPSRFGDAVVEPSRFENTGFDIVIGNPPYIQLQKSINNSQKYADLYKNQGYEVFDRTGDIYCLFYEKGLQLLKQGGILAYITSNKWMRAGYGEKLREFFIKHNPLKLVDLGPGVFENATVDTSILIIQKARNQKQLKAVTLQKEDREDISEGLKQKGVILKNLTKNAWFIGSDAEQKLKQKIERLGKPLKEWDVKIYRGVLTGLNEAFIITTEKRNEILANCKDQDERRRTEAIIKPILRGRDIKRYYYEWAGLWVIVIPAGWTNENRKDEKPEIYIQKIFPSLMQYLIQFEEKARKRDDQGDYWWELRHCAYYSEFEKEKVVYSEIVRHPQFHYDKEKFYVEATGFLMTGESVKYICGLLNSKPVSFFFKCYYAGGGLGDEGYRYKKAFLENLPLPTITSANEPIVKQIESLVDKILETKKQNHDADTSHLEREIDHLVYKLYDLTDDEIKIIESS